MAEAPHPWKFLRVDPIINFLNEIFWGYVLIYGLLAVGLFFTIRLGFVQLVYFPEMFRAVLGSNKADKAGITPFQALCTSLASRVGTGNLAGVAVALYLGGPGALFWMWVVAFLGMATAYAESTLAQLYKVRNAEGEYRGGPAFYIARGLGAPWAGAVFSVCLILAFGLVFNDTILICTATGLMILLSGVMVPGSELTGTPLTKAAMSVHIGGAGHAFIAIAIFFFAFTSIIGNYSYAENAMTFLRLGNATGLTVLRLGVLAMVLWGAYESVATVFNAADASMGLMATVNLIAIVLLSGTVVKLTRDYAAQRKAGEEPTFHAADFPELNGRIDQTIWTRNQ